MLIVKDGIDDIDIYLLDRSAMLLAVSLVGPGSVGRDLASGGLLGLGVAGVIRVALLVVRLNVIPGRLVALRSRLRQGRRLV